MSGRMRLTPTVGLAVVWILLWGNVSWGNVVAGLAVAVVVQLLFPLPRVMSGVRVHPWGFLVLLGAFLRDLVVASVWVAWLAVRPRPISKGTVIEVQLTERDDLLRTAVAELTSLVPGTVVVDLEPEDGILVMHVLDRSDPADLQAERDRVGRLERRVRRALGREEVAR
ncbi:Na+/H+ antiporter subunit E [Arsenicicoccus sp. oral taxon 190]|uniref:Na+/H+ antiporter subunit E n=1 Tax=Arsenicicoccus sp. oral taxon 190 TaxID=1658671 RepID=UPI00067CA698|nr:Na+/H+ antiporter subunit E [Arsenicicoccus sp. oral taxon 190]